MPAITSCLQGLGTKTQPKLMKKKDVFTPKILVFKSKTQCLRLLMPLVSSLGPSTGHDSGAYHPRWFMAASHCDPYEAVQIVQARQFTALLPQFMGFL